MATFKVCVQKQRADGMYIVYIRVTHNRKSGYIKTDKVINNRGLVGGEVVDPYVMKFCMERIIEYTERLNKVDIAHWAVADIIRYVTSVDEDMSFSKYARSHIDKLINQGQERNARNYLWAIQHMERYAGADNIMFSQLTSTFINKWVESMADKRRAKEMYPICLRPHHRTIVCYNEWYAEWRGAGIQYYGTS